jgi:hypothetical protein
MGSEKLKIIQKAEEMEIIVVVDNTVLFSDKGSKLFKNMRSSSSDVHHLPGWTFLCLGWGWGEGRDGLFLKRTSVSEQKDIKF